MIKKTEEVTVRLGLPQVMLNREIHNAFHGGLLKLDFKENYGRIIELLAVVKLEDGQK